MADRNDNVEVEILPDGTIRSTTDPISGANHSNAEAFFKFLEELTGGKATRNRRGHHHHHGHEHEHEHDHEHEHN